MKENFMQIGTVLVLQQLIRVRKLNNFYIFTLHLNQFVLYLARYILFKSKYIVYGKLIATTKPFAIFFLHLIITNGKRTLSAYRPTPITNKIKKSVTDSFFTFFLYVQHLRIKLH